MKWVVVLWDERARAERRAILLDRVAPALLDAGVQALSLCIADLDAAVRAPHPFPLFERRCTGLVNVFLPDDADPDVVLAPLRQAAFQLAAYRVEESIYKDYGDNANAGPRDWPDGTRSPGVVAVTLMERPKRLDRDEWIRRWHGTMSPVSERIQPRTRYVRNLVEEALTPDGPPLAGIVEESWPSARHVTNPYLFYGAANPWQLIRNMVEVSYAVTRFLTLWRIRTVMMSEYVMKS